MRIAYALGEDDLAAVLMQQTLWRRDRVRAWFERIRTGPVWRHLMVNVGPGALFGLMLYPVWLWQVRGSCPRSPVGAIYVGALAIAVVLGTALQRWRAPPRLRFKAVHRWSARRRLERSRVADGQPAERRDRIRGRLVPGQKPEQHRSQRRIARAGIQQRAAHPGEIGGAQLVHE